ncbi:MAG: hypothetical protein JOZ68_09150 [Acidimicrobiia bacterium]|nr:hypothetical protein [Acidimicrobiia bacterium]MBV9041160.1 hypothetical protein [Acidimicrobiia bacterium]MBV9285015.1 hypothetical protein [Acidimicrobiia bacterium]
MADTVLTAVYQRLDACPWVRPEAVARGRARLSTQPWPTGEQVARSMLEWVLGARTG